MIKKTIMKTAGIILFVAGYCWAGCCTEGSACSRQVEMDSNNVEPILEQLNKKTKELRSYQAQIEYKFSQPLLESQSIRKGGLYYLKNDERSMLRVNFQTLKQDDEKQQKYIEHFIFDGIWLAHIDYQIRSAKRHQLAEPNRPMDAFELAGRNLPIIGFTKIEDLEKQFEVQLVEQKKQDEPPTFIQLHLKVKPDSIYKDDYTSIDFWINKELYLPDKVLAVSTEEDIYEIKFLKPIVNKKMDGKVFEFEIPKDFSVEITPLKGPESSDSEESMPRADG